MLKVHAAKLKIVTTRNQLTLTAASRLGPPVLGDGAGRVERGLDSSSLNETILHHYKSLRLYYGLSQLADDLWMGCPSIAV